jgi:hypothetical protein
VWERCATKYSTVVVEALARSGGWGLFIPGECMTSADSLLLILRRLDEIERKLDRIMKELQPTAIGYSVRRGNRSTQKD